jgi:hypothetical protein
MSDKPDFDPSQPFEPAVASKPAFDASKPFEPTGYWSDVGHNAVKEVGDMVPSPEDALEKAKNIGALTAIPSGGVPSMDDLKRMGKMAVAAPGQIMGMAKNLGGSLYRTATEPSEEFRQRPVSTALNVASVAAPLLNELRGPAATAGEYAGRFGENQMGKLHGTSQAQFRQLGRENFRPAMRSSYEMGDANLLQGSIGREQMINERIAGLGDEIGNVRAEAGAAGPAMTPQEMADAIRQRATADFSPGGKYFDEAGSFEKNLANIKAMPEGGIENFADRASAIKSVASGNKMRMPVNAETNVASEMSHINDAEIAKRLSPEMQEHYDLLKDEFGNAKSLKPMELRAEGKEALGTSPNTLFGTVKGIAHAAVGGPKLGAQAGFGAESLLKGYGNSSGLPSGAIAAANVADKVPGEKGAIMDHVQSNPALSQWRDLFQNAMQRGQQAVTALNYVLQQRDPEYNKAFQDSLNGNGQ